MSIIYEALKKLEKQNQQCNTTVISFLLKRKLLKYWLLFFIILIFSIVSLKVVRLRITNKKATQTPKVASFKKIDSKVEQSTALQNSQKAYQTYTLQGIIYDKLKPIAFINGKKVSIGDCIDDAQIIEISSDKVILEDKNHKKIYLSID